MLISVIITNYKTWQLTEKAVRSIDRYDASNSIDEIVVVDDCSNERIPDYITHHPKVRLIVNAINMGYTSSVNRGMVEAKNEVCLLLDSDASLVEDIGSVISCFQAKEDLGILGFNLVDEQRNSTGRGDGEPNFWSIILGPKLEGMLNRYIRIRPAQKLTLYSCAIGIRKSMFIALNGFDEKFDFIDGDSDFSMRVNKTGKWKIETDDRVSIFHIGAGSPQSTSKRVIRFYKNRIKLLKKHNLFPAEYLLKSLVFLRMGIEWILISTIGRLTYSNITVKDKLHSRSEILKNIFTY